MNIRKLLILLMCFIPAVYARSDPSEALFWNSVAVDSIAASDLDVLQADRALAIVQLATFEAANAIDQRFESQIEIAKVADASITAAVASASYQSLVSQAAGNREKLAKSFKARLRKIANGSAKQKGIALGEAAAAAVLKSRDDDGADWSHEYTPGVHAGEYRLTQNLPVVGPVASHMHPFVLDSYLEFRPPPPVSLGSQQMQRDLDEVRAVGGSSSTIRTRDQTSIARFHAVSPMSNWYQIARICIQKKHLNELEATRVLSLMAMAQSDLHFAIWDAKYFYNFWRPETAINYSSAREQSPKWRPLVETPMHPEYPCAHCGYAAGGLTILEATLGSFPVQITLTSNGITRHYASIREFAQEETFSRIYAGAHFRTSTSVGFSMGKDIAERVLSIREKALSSRLNN